MLLDRREKTSHKLANTKKKSPPLSSKKWNVYKSPEFLSRESHMLDLFGI